MSRTELAVKQFAFARSLVKISARRTLILTEVFVVVLSL
jgi:hypothetical protein